MFCTKCGKQLHDGDAFCAHCGAKVREELLFKSEIKTTPRITKYDEVVFNPPFKVEAERRTQHIEEEVNPYSSEPKKEKIVFDWNLEGFPAAERKRDESFEINWDAVIERNRQSRAVTVEKILPDSGFKSEVIEEPEKKEEPVISFAPVEKEEPVEKEKEDVLSIEDLELALFGAEDFKAIDSNMPGVTIEYKTAKSAKKKEAEFYTYNSKRDAFQELLDKERERLAALENERNSQWEKIAPINQKMDYVPKKPLEFDEVFIEPKLPLVPPVREVAVALPPLTARVMADEEALVEETLVEVVAEEPALQEEVEYEVVLPPLTARIVVEKDVQCPFPGEELSAKQDAAPAEPTGAKPAGEELAEEGPKEKTKLRYSDIFPVDTFDTVGDNKSNKFTEEEIDDDDDDEEGGNIFIKIIIAILAIIVAVEIVVIGVKFVAPESNLAMVVDSVMDRITGGSGDQDGAEPSDIVIEENLIDSYITALSGNVQNIGIVNHDINLKYQLVKTYAFQDINQTNTFQDVVWNGSSSRTNGYLIVESVISYYDTWKANNPDSDIVGVNQVSIGEIRTGSNGYYVLNKVVYAKEGDALEKYETVYLEASQDKIIVKEVKEETI